MRSLLLILLVVATVSCATVASNEFKEPGPVVLSWQKMDFSRLNDKILEASNSHQGWVKDIQLYAYNLFDLSDLKKVVYELEFDNIENPTKVTVTLVRDGFLDDSVRGDIHIITFHRATDGEWKVVDLKKSHRCWRLNSDVYSSNLCP